MIALHNHHFLYVYILYVFILFLNHSHQIICDYTNNSNAQTKSCPFSGTRYPLGDNWFRRLETHDMSYCVACNCIEGGKSNCTSKPCDGLIQFCDEATELTALEKGCCQQCQDTDYTKRVEVQVKSRIDAMPNSPKSAISTTNSSTKISCLHNGRIYNDGQVFASNTSGIHKTQANQCVQCVCQAGLVLCRLKTCFSDSCSSFLDDTDNFNEDCCPLRANCQDKPIKDEDNNKEEQHLVTIYSPNDDSLGSNQRFNPNDCKSGGKVYSDGAKWHPIIGPFGQMDCVICVCKSASVECSRINCPSVHRFECAKPKRVQGMCCLTCNHDNNEDEKLLFAEKKEFTTKSSLTSSIDVTDDGLVKKVWPTNKNNESASDQSMICLPSKFDTIVYRSHAQSSISAYYQYAFQTKGTNMSTNLYSFTVKDGKIADFSQQHLTKLEYEFLTRSFRFKLLGATKLKFVEKFAKRTKKFPQRCSQRCKTRVERLERSLRIKQVETNRICLKNEIEFN